MKIEITTRVTLTTDDVTRIIRALPPTEQAALYNDRDVELACARYAELHPAELIGRAGRFIEVAAEVVE